MLTLTEIPWWYWAIAIIISLYQAYRGYRLQFLLGIGSRQRVLDEHSNWSRTDRVIVLCIADTFTFLFCALSGFYSLLVFYRAFSLSSAQPASIEHAALLIFLLVYGVLGITGKLPDTLNRFKLPSSGG
jgi:hypothetical protein